MVRERGPASTFVCESIEPETEGMEAARLAGGEPDFPKAFTWRGRRYEVSELVRTWRTYHIDRGDRYVDKHWFEIYATSGERMRIYCKRRATTGGRWILFSVGCAD